MTKYYCDRCGKETKETHREIVVVERYMWRLRRRDLVRELELCRECCKELENAESKVDAYRVYLNNDFIGKKIAKESRMGLIDENVELIMRNQTLAKELTDARKEIERFNICLSLKVRSEGEWVYLWTGECLLGTDAPLNYKCSCCGELATDPFNFCPNCGAEMKGGVKE